MSDSNSISAPAPSGPLQGVRIVDLTSVIMGPYATQILADYGADVIKVEPPEGDIMRKGGATRSPDMGFIHLQLNRNKRSVVLDLKQEAGRAALLHLCRGADVLVSNMRPAAMQRLRLSDAEVRADNPRLIYVSLVGYGQQGPYAAKPAYDDLMQGICGLASLFPAAQGGEPRYVPLAVVDRIVGLNATHAILAALLQRGRTGQGSTVELAMFEAMSQFVLGDHFGGRAFEPPVGGETGYGRLMTPNRRPYRTSDGYVCVLVYTDKNWRAFFEALGRSGELAADPKLATHAARARNYDYVYGLLAEILLTRTTAEWLALFERCDIPCVPLNDLDALIDDPHLAAVDFFTELDHPTEGRLRYTGIPSRWDGEALGIRRHAPHLGEHSVEVLREAGVPDSEIETLLAEGATMDGAMKGG
jgi:crotonobetainyl-CoA:carnitine CoA-transferase CaiB-like acyl-CoA transferase